MFRVSLSWNHAAEKLYGYPREEIVGLSMEVLYPPNWPRRITDYIADIIKGDLIHFEVVRKTKSGSLRTISVSAAPIRSSSGEALAISNIHRDITAEKEAAERQRFITQELTHRTKNMLAVIFAIERQTARRATSVEDFHERFSGRLQSLLDSNDLLVATDWAAIPLRVLAERQLSAFLDAHPGKIQIDGPQIVLKPVAVQAVGMSFHELGTNALKYGALGSAQGKLTVSWNAIPFNLHGELQLVWKETGVRVSTNETSHGFGHTVLTTFIQQKLGAEVDYELRDDGVYWSAKIPRQHFDIEV